MLQEVKAQKDPELLVLETDNVLFKDEGFRCVHNSTQLCRSAEELLIACMLMAYSQANAV